MTEEITRGIYRIAVPLPNNPLRSLNSFLIQGKDRNLLIDTGFNHSECLAALSASLDELGVDKEQTDIFLTHLHADHIGLCERIAAPGSRILMGRTDLAYMQRMSQPGYWDSMDPYYVSLGFSPAELDENKHSHPFVRFGPENAREYTAVDEGHVFDLGHYRLQTVETPGHTPGHMCLHDPAEKLLFCGDHIIFSITPNIATWPGFENPLAHYQQSLKKVQALDVSLALSAHRDPSGDCKQRIEELLAHHRERLAETLEIVQAQPGLNGYEIAARMRWQIRAKSWVDFPINQKWFATGEAAAHLEALLAQGAIGCEETAGQMIYFAL